MMLAEKYAEMDIASMRSEEHAEGCAEGRDSILYELVEEGSLTVEKAAKKAGVSEDMFINGLLLTGHKLP